MEGEGEDEQEGRGGTGLTVRCCHQGLELLGLGRRLWPGAGSHGDLGSSGCPAAKNKTKEKKSSSINVSCPLCACVRLTGLMFGASRRKDKAADSDVNSLTTPQQIEQGECVVYRTGWRGKQRCAVKCTLPTTACASYLHSLAAGAVPSSKST